MLNATDLLNAVKKAALDAVDASQPSDFCFGKVISISPIKVLVEQKLILSQAQLVLTETVAINSPLVVGDQVVLLKKKGGQKYLILDKAVVL